jgi:PAS domain S-box-containing protein
MGGPHSRKSILLVEDEAIIALNESAQLQKHGYDVITAPRAEKAVEIALNRHVDLILMDIDLGKGKMDGTEAAQIILREKDLPVIFLTSHAEKETVDRVKGITRYGYVLKSAGEFVLIESISMAFELFASNQRLKKRNEFVETVTHDLETSLAELTAIYRNTPLLLILVDSNRRVRKANAAAAGFTGSPAEIMIGKQGGEALRCIHHLDDPRGCGFGPRCSECTVRSIVQRTFDDKTDYRAVEASLAVQRDGTQKLDLLVSTSYFHHRDEELCLVAIEDITDRKEIQKKLKDESHRLNAIIEGTHVGTWEWNVKTGETRFNERWAEMLGYTLEELSPLSIETWRRFVHPDDFVKSEYLLKQHLSGELDYYECECRMRHRDGRWVWILDRGKIADWTEDGEPLWVFGTHQDITKQKKSLLEKDFLMRELNHRVKNNLMLITSLINLKNTSLGKEVDLSDLVHQVEAVRMVHEKMYRSEDVTHISLPDYIGDLLSAVFSFSPVPVTIEKDIENIHLETKKTVPLGLIINEIATNAMKHGFNSEPDDRGQVNGKPHRFGVRLVRSSADGGCILTLENSGKPFPQDISLDNPDTLGLRLISTLVEQIDGELKLEREPSPVFTVKFR